MSADIQQPKPLTEDPIVPRILEILQGHELFPDGLGSNAFGGLTLARYPDLHNEVSLYLRREESNGPVSQAMVTTREDNEIVSIEECHAINGELDALMVAEGRIG